VGTEHILLGLLNEGSGVGANVLKNLEIDLRKVRLEVERYFQSGPHTGKGKLPLTPRAKKVVELSIQEAQYFNHNYVGTEHLLLGLLREQESVAAQVLMNLGLKLEDVREEVLNLLGPNAMPEEARCPKPEIPTVQDWNTAFLYVPEEILLSLREVNDCIEKLTREKDEAIALQDFAKAAALLESADRIKRKLLDFANSVKVLLDELGHDSD
jgi:ATP-dependent Clp protease ATP-binding subunit ClpA